MLTKPGWVGTDGSGRCTVSLSTKGNSLTFTVDGLSGGSFVFQPADNDVTTSITVNKP